MADEPLYTETECIAEIKQIDAEIRKIRRAPASQSVKGFSAHFMGRIKDLQAEREQWKRRLNEARSYELGRGSTLQGPTLVIE